MKNPLKKFGVTTWKDLLYFFPVRYEDFSRITLIQDVVPEKMLTLKVKIQIIENRRSYRKRISLTEAIVADATGSLKIIWFNQPYLAKVLAPGEEVYLTGTIKYDRYGTTLQAPLYEKVKEYQRHTGRIVPIYKSTEGITQKQIRYLVDKALKKYLAKIQEWEPKTILQSHGLAALSFALQQMHFPKNQDNLEQARKRLEFDEMFLIQLFAASKRAELLQESAPSISFHEEETKKIIGSLPFSLTQAQKKSSWEILKDMQKTHPMNRILEGDVGSGKTIVAGIALFNAALSKYRSLLMCPTEILAEQHYKSLKQALPAISMELVLGKIKKTSGQAQVLIGTHALLHRKTLIKNVGLVIVDEQHRFGVEQRKSLQAFLGLTPHFLSMTATPIPRSLALTLYGDLDLSVLDEYPAGRKTVITKIVPPHEQQEAYQHILQEIQKGRQIFVVCPVIDASDKRGVKAVTEEQGRLQKIFPKQRIALLHGRMKNKDAIMQEFQQKKYDILVATPVIEVGIDVANASLIMIMSAERFGLAQLHQLRGRVQRSTHQGYCYVLSESENPEALKRLHTFQKTKNGFELAEFDLETRGPGDVFGKEQTGFPELRIARLTNYTLINITRDEAKKIIPILSQFPALQQELRYFSNKIHLE